MANLFDTTNYPTTEPTTIVAGDRLTFKRTNLSTDYPVADYVLQYSARLEKSGSTEIAITAIVRDGEYVVEIGRLVTEGYAVGVYHWQAYIVRNSDSERVTVDEGTWEVEPNRVTSNVDPRGHVKKVLDAIEATIEGRASKDQESYSIQGRSLARTPIADLILLRGKYKAEYVQMQRAEKLRNGLGNSANIKVRF